LSSAFLRSCAIFRPLSCRHPAWHEPVQRRAQRIAVRVPGQAVDADAIHLPIVQQAETSR